MREFIASVSATGRVTIPSEICRHLQIHVPGKVAFIVDDRGAVLIRPSRVEWKDLEGSIPPIPGRETGDFEDFIDEAMQAEADRIVREMGGL